MNWWAWAHFMGAHWLIVLRLWVPVWGLSQPFQENIYEKWPSGPSISNLKNGLGGRRRSGHSTLEGHSTADLKEKPSVVCSWPSFAAGTKWRMGDDVEGTQSASQAGVSQKDCNPCSLPSCHPGQLSSSDSAVWCRLEGLWQAFHYLFLFF